MRSDPSLMINTVRLNVSQSAMSQSVLRLLDETDRAAFLAHLLRLGPKGRYNRFSASVSDDTIMAYALRPFKAENFIFGFFDQGVLRGVAEAHGMDEPCPAVELAFSIELGWRGQGLGKVLFDRAVAEARKRGVRELHLHCLAHNFAMLSLLRQFTSTIRFEDNEAYAVIVLAKD